MTIPTLEWFPRDLVNWWEGDEPLLQASSRRCWAPCCKDRTKICKLTSLQNTNKYCLTVADLGPDIVIKIRTSCDFCRTQLPNLAKETTESLCERLKYYRRTAMSCLIRWFVQLRSSHDMGPWDMGVSWVIGLPLVLIAFWLGFSMK